MNSQEFVELLQRGVFEGGVEDTRQVLEDPPGKRPSPALVELSDWYKGLPPEGQAAAVEVARLTARYCVFGFLTLLDGVALFPTEGKRGTFKLSYADDGGETLVNDPKQEFLHDIFRSLVPPL